MHELPGGSAPVAGHDIVLTIDVNVQAVAEQALREELDRARARPVRSGPAQLAPAGSVVVLDPADGSVVAMASYPDYDPSQFTDGIDQAECDYYFRDPANHYPLINRAIEGQYAPGSTFKLITAYAALTNGLHHAGDDVGRRWRLPHPQLHAATAASTATPGAGPTAASTCAGPSRCRATPTSTTSAPASGSAAISTATASRRRRSSSAWARTRGVPLPNEKSGRVMTPEEYAQRHEDNPEAFPDGVWQAGDNVNIAIGQGEMLTTPIQLANAYAALGNGGTLFAPNIALEVREAGSDVVTRTFEPRIVRQITFDPSWRAALMDGFTGVTTVGRGHGGGQLRRLPRLDHRRQDRHGPGRRTGRHRRLRRHGRREQRRHAPLRRRRLPRGGGLRRCRRGPARAADLRAARRPLA